ncbi:histidine kinase [Sphingomonas sp.]|uniref:HAMP domain-containing sensor histidine kinase n=1 Tax=Sphingomonas sp. TaxID=28214 RepID=UPI003B3B1750
MSLRIRVIALFALALVASLILGAMVVGYHVRKELATELEAAMAGAKRSAAATFEDLPRSDHPLRDLHQLVQTFDGNRHVRLSLVAANGQTLVSSQPGDSAVAPAWFSRLVAERLPAAILPVPVHPDRPLALLLASTPGPDTGAAWDQALALAKVLGGVSVVGLVLVWLAIGTGLRPLAHVSEQFARLGAGDYDARVVEAGPPELRLLQRGFNDMTERLGSTMHRNRLLGEQLAQLQDEERAEIARDLHDEVGPRLFAISLDAAMIAQLCEAGQPSAAADRAREIQHAVLYVQGQVRDLLGWLRPARLTEFGLAVAIQDLVRFWAARRADITFDVEVAEADIGDQTAEVAYRIVQEAVSNAVRHAEARRIGIEARVDPYTALVVTIENDGVRPADAASDGRRGYGLIGMRERVEAHGGTLTYGPNAAGSRWTVEARLPGAAAPAAQAQRRDAAS